MFSKSTYINRRNHLRSQLKSGIAVFLGNDEAPMNYTDNTYHYRQDSSFLYYFGIEQSGLVGIIDFELGNDAIFGTDFTIDDIVWMGSQPTIKEKSEQVGIDYVGCLTDFEKRIQKAQASKQKIHFLPPYRDEHRIKLFRWLQILPENQAKEASVELIVVIGEQRIVKTTEEIIELEEAANITVNMHLAALRFAKPGMTEAQVAAKVHEVALAAGGNIAFPIIATINGQTLHNHYHGNTLKSGQMFLLDAGYETPNGYAGDMSSTFPVDQKFTSRQKEIYAVSLQAHEAALAKLKPGINFREVHFAAAMAIAQGLKELGFMKGNPHDAVDAGAHALFFPCGTGHLLGLDVHDMENLGEQHVGYAGKPKSTLFGLKSLRLARPLQPGFVLTIEPGIYFIPELIALWKNERRFTEFINYDKVEQYKDFSGCRNEEDVLITETGYKILGKPLAKTVKEVEQEREKAFN
ncbi:MAG: aminopeptidase P family protein [Salinivirgaceae bacterium]|nr:aminopeptidase P family protein [Salinivirgaceae bacterium]